MAHLKKADSGHLFLGNSGHLMNDCSGIGPPSSESCQDCVANCNGAASIIVVVSGCTGLCTEANRAHTCFAALDCEWQEPFPASPKTGSKVALQCISYGGGVFDWRLSLQSWINDKRTGWGEVQHAKLVCSGDHPTGSDNINTWIGCIGNALMSVG